MFTRQMSDGKTLRHSLIRSTDSSIVAFGGILAKGIGLDFPVSIPEVLQLSVKPDDFTDPYLFRDSYLLSEVLSKYPFRVPGLDRKAAAMAKFHEAEAQCNLVNSTIRSSTTGPSGLEWHTVIQTARAKIERLLGSFSWNQVEDHCAFGPGATTSRKRVEGDAVYKIGNKPDVTFDCALLAWVAVYRIPRWFELLSGSLPSASWRDDLERFPPEMLFRYVVGNKVSTVPKNAKTDRVTAAEPDMNMFLQKGLGSVIRRKLLRAGIDLNTQRKNQMLARKGSLYGNLATIDFSSASDTISNEVVELLLPEDWLTALKQCRSPVGVLADGTLIQYAKFSSMGNGYTFELESLIFWGLARAVCDMLTAKHQRRGIVMVYGDDLIVNAVFQEPLKWAFSRAGFTLNEKKSFFSGPFRESCGKHYFRGVDVSPFYIKKPLTNIWAVYNAANKLRRWFRLGWGVEARGRDAYEHLVSRLPAWARQLIPDGLGDVGLIADFDDARPKLDSKQRKRGIFVWSATGYLPIVKRSRFQGFPVLVKWFLLRRDCALEESVETRQVVTAALAVTKRFRVQQWINWGPWI